MNVIAPAGSARNTIAKKPVSGFRLDIEGLRAIAVVSVVIWHAGVTQLPGGFIGVDVFFVISGFLMTGILYRELLTSGRVNFLQFFARRVKRLIPASVFAISVTLVASWLILTPSRVLSIAYDAIASIFYVVNWRLADGAVDYFAQDQSVSPLQHFWSLSVEEQFYIFWPLLLGFVGLLVGWGFFSVRVGVTGALTLVFVSSLAWSMYFTAIEPGRAYFVTTTRLWELALGGLVAVALANRSAYPKLVSAVFAWTGLALIVAAAFLFTTDMAFPGWIALVPTVGTALLIALTPSAGSAGPRYLLSVRPMAWIGSISYSLYLWHWPVIVLGAALITRSTRDFTVGEGLLLAAVSVLPAWASLKLIEDPIRRSQWAKDSVPNTLFVGLVASGLALVLGMSMATNIRSVEPIREAQGMPAAFSAGASRDESETNDPVGAELLALDPEGALAGEVKDSVGSIYPTPAAAAKTRSVSAKYGCHASFEDSIFSVCELGDRDGDTTIMIAGDSHAGHWVPALVGVAEQRGWKLVVATKSSCPLTTASVAHATMGDYSACAEWNLDAIEYLEGPERPDILVMSSSTYDSTTEGGREAFVAGALEIVNRAKGAGAKVVALRDTPRPPMNVAECVDVNRDSLSRCAFGRKDALAKSDKSQAEIVARSGIPHIDLTRWICPREICAPVIGGVLVWRDTNHLTNEYSTTLGLALGSELDRYVA